MKELNEFKCDGCLLILGLFDYVILDMKLVWEEFFGLIFLIICVKDVEEVVVIVNKFDFGL